MSNAAFQRLVSLGAPPQKERRKDMSFRFGEDDQETPAPELNQPNLTPDVLASIVGQLSRRPENVEPKPDMSMNYDTGQTTQADTQTAPVNPNPTQMSDEEFYGNLPPLKRSDQMSQLVAPVDQTQQTPTTPTPASTTTEQKKSRSAQRLALIQQMQDAPIQRENSFGKRLASGLWNSFKLWGQQGAPGGIGGLLGSLAVGGSAFAASPEMMGNFKKDQAIKRQLGEYQQDVALEDSQMQQALKQEQIDAIPFNAETRRLEIENRRQTQEDNRTSRAVSQIAKMPYFDPNNPAHAALATEGRLDPESLKGWDFRKRETKTVNGTTYSRDPSTGAYSPTNLPADESKTLTDYTVTVNGEKLTFKVPQDKAAAFANQMAIFGGRMEMDEKKLEWDRTKFMKSFGLQVDKLARDAANDSAKRASLKQDKLLEIEKAYKDRQIDDATRTEMIAEVNRAFGQ